MDPRAEKWAFAVQKDVSGVGTIRGITMNELFDEFGIDRIDLLKLDIEGAEKEVFGSGPTAWLDRVGVIAIELHDCFKPGCSGGFLFGA